jgi:type III pantothenate kinase
LEQLGDTPEAIWVANVAGQSLEDALRRAAPDLADAAWHFERTREQCLGLTNGYRQPALLGVDRWIAMIAAFARVGEAVCVVDAGTACTLDAVDSAGRHLGGVIAPGVGLMQSSLRKDTSDIDLHAKRSSGNDEGLFAKSTAGAIASGSVFSLAALAERGVRELGQVCGHEPALILTGGDAELVARQCQVPCIVVPELVLEGLNLIAENEL